MGELVELRPGLPTSVGPLPFTDPEHAANVALASQPELATVPSPGSGPTSLLAQAVDGLPGVEASPSGLLRVERSRFSLDAALDAVSAGNARLGPSHEGLRVFLDIASAAEQAPGGLRVPLVGPVTLALALRAAGVDLGEARQIARAVVTERVDALMCAVRHRLPEHLPVLVCLGEPGLVGGMHPTFPLSPTETLELLEPVVDRLDGHPRAGSLLIGAHVPGRTDWDVVVASGVSVLSLPAGAGLGGWASTIGDFLDRGGRIAWGAVPVDQPLGSSEELLWRKLSAVWCELVGEGLDPLALRSRSLVSPVDGLGHFGPTQAELALGLVGSLATRVGRQAVAARLSLGA